MRLDCGYRLNLLVESVVIVEIKAVEALTPVHQARLISYLRLTGCPVGLLIYFHTARLRDGIRRLMNPATLPPP